jgi:serine/threonine-protein kinase
MDADSLDRLAAALADRYRIERLLGAGGMATVYLAQDLRHGRRVALKVLRPELAAALGPERFLREIGITAALSHPHIVPLYDSGEAEGNLFYVMPYVEGESLRDRLQRERQLPLEDAVAITRQAASALASAHARGVVHRDIKPENILLSEGQALVADFGIARAVAEAGANRLTETGLAVGTVAYMSPEQASGDPALDSRSDIYSLGCVAYEMLAGEPPFTGPTAAAVLARKAVEAVPSLTVVRGSVSPGVEQAIRKALARVPADRFKTVTEFAEALELGRTTTIAAAWPVPRRRMLMAAAAAVVAIPAVWAAIARLKSTAGAGAIRSVAVLPFANLSGDPEQDYFAVGMTEELSARLSEIAGLTVKSRTSVTRFRGSEEPIPAIAKMLGVDALVEGSVARSADRVRIRAQLVQAQPERGLWGHTYDRALTDALAVQTEVARAIAGEIGMTLTPAAAQRLERGTAVNPAAADAYFKGRYYWNRRTGDDLLLAIKEFERAVALDPAYARAHVGLADCYLLLAWSSMLVLRPGEALSKAKAAALTALEIDANLAEAHTSLAYVDTYSWNWKAAERGFLQAIALDASYGTTHFWYAAQLAAVGRLDEAVTHAREGQRLEPVSPIITSGVAWMLHLARRYEESAQEARRALALHPGFPVGHLRLGIALGLLGRHDEAVRELEAGLVASDGSPGFTSALAHVHAAAGRRNEARAQLTKLLEESRRRYVPGYDIAAGYVATGQIDQAFAWLQRGFEEQGLELTFIAVEPTMDPLRGDPRFRRLLQRINLRA